MPATERLAVDLPADMVDMIEARVASGEFASTSAFVLARLEEWALPSEHEDLHSQAMRALLTDAEEINRRIDAGMETTIPADIVVSEIRAKLRALAERETRKAAAE